MQTYYELTDKKTYAPGRLTETDVKAIKGERPIVGQERALEALAFGIRMDAAGYNIFCAGPKGVGRTSLTLETVRSFAATQPTPEDWVFVHNFEVPHKPLALHLPAGKARPFERDIKKMVDMLKNVISVAFTDEVYRIHVAHIEQKFRSEKEAYFTHLQNLVETSHVALMRLPTGVAVAPAKEGQVLTPEVFNQLPKSERKVILDQMTSAQERLEKALKETPAWETERQEEINTMNVTILTQIVDRILKPLQKNYASIEGIPAWLESIRQALLDHVALLVSEELDEASLETLSTLWSRLSVNVLVSHKPTSGAPVIHVNHPTLSNLLGKIERTQRAGTQTTDFSLIRPGALHLANGGYLVIEAKDLLENGHTWGALKRCLFSKEIKMESGIDDNSIFGSVSQDPSPIPLNVKVLLIGETGLYYALASQDDEFTELFKIQSQFAEKMPRTPESEKLYARVLSFFIQREKLKPFTTSAFNRMIEFSSRLTEDQQRLSTYLIHVNDLMREAHFIAVKERKKKVDADVIEAALTARSRRFGMMQDNLLSAIDRGQISIATTGERVGQINALLVYEFGVFGFGAPTRVTCQVRVGQGELLDIEREVSLGGPLHTKGVLKLTSFLGGRFAQHIPLSLDASLVFEQSYSEVDGDSASSAEMYCLLSAIGNIPLKQGFAVTGAVNQLGEVQAIGAVNEKIEGFFDVCVRQGLTGEQGVIIPEVCSQNLMLKKEVREAIKAKKFHIYPVKTIDEGMSILTGLPAGVQDKKGHWTPNSVNARVEERLKTFYKCASKTAAIAKTDAKTPKEKS